MEARICKVAAPAAVARGTLLLLVLAVSMGARQQTANFIVETPDPAFARQVAQAAEHYRRQLAVEWLGKAMPDWAQPCVMTVQVGPHHQEHILDAHDQKEGPEDEREDPQDVLGIPSQRMVPEKGLLQRVEGARSDVPVDYPEGGDA